MGLKFIGIENPNPPPIVSTRPTPDPIGQALGVFLVGEALYVCDGPAGVQIVDAADPRLPVFVDNIPLVGARHVSVHESVAYVAGENTVLQLDVRDPFAPLILSASMPGAERVAANDSLVFLAQGRADVAVYRVTSPGGPEFAQRIGATGGIFAFDVAVSGSYAYVSWGTAGLQVIEIDRIGTPAPPVVASLATSGAAKGIAISGQHAVVAVTSGLEVIDIQLPTAPVLNGLLGAPGNSSFVTVSGSTAYLASGLVGVHVISIRDPMKPTITGSLNSGGTVLGVAADRFFAYVVDRDDGLVVTAAQCED
jgi:hypothetical protein